MAASCVSTTALAPVSSTMATRAPLICAATWKSPPRPRTISTVPLAAQRGAAGHQFGHHAVADVAQLDAIGVADHQHEADHDPEQRGFERLPTSRSRNSTSTAPPTNTSSAIL